MPPPWGQLQQRLQQEQDPQAQRVLEWLQAHPDAPTPLPVSVWIAADGRISKLEFDSLGDTQVDAALRATLQSAPCRPRHRPTCASRCGWVWCLPSRSTPCVDVLGRCRPPTKVGDYR